MPWHQEPTKDVVHCEKHRGAVCRLRAGDIRMGKPGGMNSHHSRVNKIAL